MSVDPFVRQDEVLRVDHDHREAITVQAPADLRLHMKHVAKGLADLRLPFG
jgi:hypothetical protein